MSRSIKKGIYVPKKIFNKIQKLKQQKVKNIKIKHHKKNFIILPEFLNVLFIIYNGKKYVDVFINEEKIGHKLGEFVMTRKHGRHTLVTKASRKKIKN